MDIAVDLCVLNQLNGAPNGCSCLGASASSTLVIRVNVLVIFAVTKALDCSHTRRYGETEERRWARKGTHRTRRSNLEDALGCCVAKPLTFCE